MMKKISHGMNKSLTIEGVPKAQKRHRFGKGFVYDPSKQDKAQLLPLLRSRFSSLPTAKPVGVALVFYMPIPKSYTKKKKALMQDDTYPHTNKPDIDNMVKFYLDCLPFDDKVIYKIEAEKIYSPRPRVEMLILY
jgi:Holliday junction resolvase RusA-like endonuclease